MDPYSSPYIIPNNNPYNPFLHSLLSSRRSATWRFRITITKASDPVRSLNVLIIELQEAGASYSSIIQIFP